MARLSLFRRMLLAAAMLGTLAAVGCEGDKLSPEDDALGSSAEATSSASTAPAAPTGSVQPSRDPAELNIRKRSAGDYDIDTDVTIAVQIDLRSGALPLTKLATGYRLDSAAPGSLPRRLGLLQSDELISLNNVLLLDADAADLGYQQGLESGLFVLRLKRDGKQRTIEYRLESGARGALSGLSARQRRDALRKAGVSVKRERPSTRSRDSSYRAPFDDVVDALKSGVKETGDNSFEVDRALFPLCEKYPALLSRRIYDSKLDGGGARAASSFDSLLTALGMKRGDMVQQFAGEPVSSREELAKAFAAAGKLSSFSVNVHRRDNTKNVELSYKVVGGLLDDAKVKSAIEGWGGRFSRGLSKKPRSRGSASPRRSHKPLDITAWVKLTAKGVYEVRHAGIKAILDDPRVLVVDLRMLPKDGGMRLSAIRRGSPAAVLGFKNGDIVLKVDNRRVFTMRSLIRALKRSPLGVEVMVTLKRRGKEIELRFRRTA